MIGLTDRQTDALTELVNIAFGLTAAKLSEITGSRVVLEVPVVSIHPITALTTELESCLTGPVTSVHQVFTGPVSGDAMLFLTYEGAIKLSNLLNPSPLQAPHFDPASGEILTEVGNMLLSACLSVFGNLLQMHLTFSVPSLHLDSLAHFLSSISVSDYSEERFAVVITASFKIFAQGVEGRIVIVLGLAPLELLIQSVDRWENGTALSK